MKMNTNRSDGANKTTKSAPKAAPRKKPTLLTVRTVFTMIMTKNQRSTVAA